MTNCITAYKGDLKHMTDDMLIHYVKEVHKCMDQTDHNIIQELVMRLEVKNDKLSSKN